MAETKASKDNILMSIKPEYVDMIFHGNKKYEFRKHGFKRPVEKVFVYSTKPICKIVGFFTFNQISRGTPAEIWESCSEFAGISGIDFFEYFKNRNIAYAIKIEGVFELSSPISPYDMVEAFKPPRTFMYIDSLVGHKAMT
jgi:predicted transcriptional regulator